jgi:phage terminase small subunit
MAENGSLTAKQERLLAALMAGSTIVDAAKAANIAERTAHRWLKDDAFQVAYKAARRAAFDETLLALMTGTATALKVLFDAMKNGETYAVRVNAARIWLEHALQVHKNEEHEARIVALEEVIEGLKHARYG